MQEDEMEEMVLNGSKWMQVTEAKIKFPGPTLLTLVVPCSDRCQRIMVTSPPTANQIQ